MTLKQKINQLGWKKVLAITVLAAIDVFTIAAPYYLKSLIPNIHLYLNVEESDVSQMTAIIGWVTLIMQIPSGWLTDKFSSRWLLIVSVIITGLVTFWFGSLILESSKLSTSVLRGQYYAIFAIWGVSSTLLFWAPLWKLVSLQADKENQGLVYGLQGSLNGVIGLVFVFAIGLIVQLVTQSYVSQNSTNSNYRYDTAFVVYIYIFGLILLLTAFGLYFFVKEKKSLEKVGVKFKDLILCMQDWRVWALSFFLLGMYMFQSTFAYFLNQMLINVVELPGIALIVIGGIRLYGLRFAISAWVGKISDRLSSLTLALIVALFLGFILVVIFIFLPELYNTNSEPVKITVQVFMVLIFFMTSVLSWIMVTLRYAQIGEIKRPANSYGTVTAVLSFVGFSSDAWFYQVASSIQDKAIYQKPESGKIITNQTGYQIIIAIGIGVAFLGLFMGFLVWYSNYRMMRPYGIRYYRWRELN
ncbi:MFS transporter [[Mycoplasma] cavipharyngis]|uniref:MFS transporter n=1 Tax=[Mycoplasma] cavipharyngis TaxID=92757 RepID=UPI0037047F21